MIIFLNYNDSTHIGQSICNISDIMLTGKHYFNLKVFIEEAVTVFKLRFLKNSKCHISFNF